MQRLCVLAVLAGLLITGFAQCQEVIGTPRVALVYSDYGDFRHRDDYDAKFRQLGWRLDKYENVDFGKLVEKLGEYDIVLGSALYNYSNVQDFSTYRYEMNRFMQRGGAFVWTDANYVPHLQWLSKMGKGWAVGQENAPKIGTPMKWLDASHPLFNTPNKIASTGSTWAHLLPGEGWQVISKSADDKATGLYRPVGRGFILVTCFWAYSEQLLENVWGALQLQRSGLSITFPDYSDLDLGSNVLRATMSSNSPLPIQAGISLVVTQPSGEETEYKAEAQIDPGKSVNLRLDVPLTQRGQYRLHTKLLRDRRVVYQSRRSDLVIPDLLTVNMTEPKYRTSVHLPSGMTTVGFHAAVYPYLEDLKDLRIAARLKQNGKVLTHFPPRALKDREVDLRLQAVLTEPGTAYLDVELTHQNRLRKLATVTKPIEVYAPRKPQVTIDESLATRVNGELYFPISVYHISIDDLPRAKELGFNSFQGWGNTMDQARNNLDAAQALDMTVILEMSSYLRGKLNLEGLEPMIDEFKDHPALLAWYSVDEPNGEEQLSWCRAAYSLFAEKDPYHPVYLVMCVPGSFARFGTTTDILGIDPYPIPNSVVMVADWLKRAEDALEGLRPVWMIPQLHNWSAYRNSDDGRGPTPEEERNMVYQGLIWGAKGIVYYPWDDTVTGLKYEPVLMEAVGKINRELEAIGVELLKCEREMTAANDEASPALYAAVFRGEDATYVIAASVAYEAREFTVPAPGVGAGELEVMFEDRTIEGLGDSIKDSFEPLAVHVYRTK